MQRNNYKVFFDTNIIIDILSKREKSSDSRKLFSLYKNKRFKIYICSKQISDIYYILKTYVKSKDKRKKYIKKITNVFNVLDFTKNNIKTGLKINRPDFEDDLLIAVAKMKKMDFIITNNIKDFKHCKLVKSLTPSQFIQMINNP